MQVTDRENTHTELSKFRFFGVFLRGAERAREGAAGAMFGGRVEAPAPVVASSRRAKTSASFVRFSSFSTMPTPRTRRDENLARQDKARHQHMHE